MAFQVLAASFGPEPGDPIGPGAPPPLDRAARLRLWFYRRLGSLTLLLPLGLLALWLAILVWWPLGVVAIIAAAVGLAAVFEFVRTRRMRRRLRPDHPTKGKKPC